MHCTIFRKKRQGSSRAGQTVNKGPSDDDSFVLSFPTDTWPPAAIVGTESTDTKFTTDKPRQGLNRSVPLQVESSESRGATAPLTGQQHPSYYKIEMQGSQVQLLAGDDNSIQITPDHNHNIQSTGSKNNLARASPIAEQSFESPRLPLKASEMGQKWTVNENGDIVALSARPYLSTPSESSPPLHTKLGVPSLKGSDSSPPLLTKASYDSLSDDSNELTLPESPPRMNRSIYNRSLFQEDSSRSSSSGKVSLRSRSTKSPSPVNIDMKEVQTIMDDVPMSEEQRKHAGCGRIDFMSQLLDFFNLTCGAAVVCRDGNCLSSPESGVQVN
jgi:hypothetical protein